VAKRNGGGLSVKVWAAVIRSIVAATRCDKPTYRCPLVNIPQLCTKYDFILLELIFFIFLQQNKMQK
jgi:hypothetical protein